MTKRILRATYPYTDADGNVIAEKQRFEPKDFRWRVRMTDGTWAPKFPDDMTLSDLPLYRMPEIQRATLDEVVYYVEGEKDADNLTAVGVIATTSPEGANLPPLHEKRWEPLKGRKVVILPDNDGAGQAYGDRVFESLVTVARSVQILRLPNLPPKGDVSDWLEGGGTREELERLVSECPVSAWTEPGDARAGHEIAEEIYQTINRYVVLSDDAARALSLWVLHTHAFEATEAFTPYIHITSPTRESGKTTLIDVLEALTPDPLRADSASAAAIYRAVDRGRGRGDLTGAPPTLFLDELDAVFGGAGGKSEKAEALRGVLNSGFKRDGRTLVCDGDQHEPRSFVTFCPKVLAGIGQLPDTITSRSIPIPMVRATRTEVDRLQPARHRDLQKLSYLRADIAKWAAEALPRLQAQREPVLGLKARHDDVWGPLLNIADDCGSQWPTLAREAARRLHEDTGDSTDGRDAGIALLADLQDIFNEERSPYVTSQRLSELLRLMEGRPWPEYSRGGPITVHAISRLLRPHGITPKQERVGGEKVRAYFANECAEAFRRYLPPPPGASGTTGTTEAFPTENGCPALPLAGGGVAGTRIGTSAFSSQNGPAVPLVPLVPLPQGGMPFAQTPLSEGGFPVSWT